MTDPLEAAFLRLRHAADADEYVPPEQVIDAVLNRLRDSKEHARRLNDLYEAACKDIGDLQDERDRLRAALLEVREALATAFLKIP